jgi:hypothetical protein
MVVNGQSKELIRLLNRVVANTKAAADSRSTWDAIEIKALVEMMLPLWAIVGVQPGLLIGDETILEPLVGNRITIVLPRRQGFPEGPSCWLKLVDPDTRSLRYLLLNAGKKDSEDALAKDVSQLMHIADAWTQWIENHANDDNDDRGTADHDGDGADEPGKAFTWGGRRFDRLTGGMMRVLMLLHDERRKGHPNVPSSIIGHRANVSIDYGVKSQVFKLNRKGGPPVHPVSEIVIDNGDGTHRLIDPDKVPGKVPDGS